MPSLIKRAVAPAAPAAPQVNMIDEYRKRIKLDRHALDLAAEEQPELFLAIADQHVLAVSRRDGAKDELMRTDARLGREVRAQMEKEGQKPTEGKIADQVLGKEEHLTAADKFSASEKEVNEWAALRSTMEHRKSMIRELATLYASGYYTAGASGSAGARIRDKDAAAGRERLAAEREQRDKK